MIIDFIFSDAGTIHTLPFDPDRLFDDPRGISGTEINMFGLAFAMARKGHKVRIFSKFTQYVTREGVLFLDYEQPPLDISDVTIAYHNGRCLRNWNTRFKIALHQTFTFEESGADLYLTAADFHKRYHEARTNYKWDILPNACDLGKFHSWNPEKGRMIFHTDPPRGLHILLKALPEIKRRVPEAHLHLYNRVFSPEKLSIESRPGSCHESFWNETLRMMTECKEFVTIHARAHSRNEMLEAISKSAVYAYPSEPVSPCECFPISVMECCASGTPVVLSPADGIEELFHDAVSLTLAPPSQNLDAFIEETVRILSNENYANEISRKGRNWASKFSFDDIAAKFEMIITKYTNKAIESVPVQIESKKLRIGFFIPEFWVPTPIDLNTVWNSTRGLTGSEGSCIGYALAMSRLGHCVTIFTKLTGVGDLEKVTCCPFKEWEDIYCKQTTWDVLCSWLGPEPLKLADPSIFRLFNQQVSDFNLTEKGWESYVDLLTPLSHSHANFMVKQTNFPRNKWRVCSNGVDLNKFAPGQKVPGKVVWASSHDRGLHRLLEIWPKIKRAVPHANLHIFYNLHAAKSAVTHNNEFGNRSRYILEVLQKLEGSKYDVYVHGSVSRERMQCEMATAEILAYPLDPIHYTETFGVSVLEACASGCVPVLCAQDCFGELWAQVSESVPAPYMDHKEEYTLKLISLLNDKDRMEKMAIQCVAYAQKFSWEILAKNFETTLLTRGEQGLPSVNWEDSPKQQISEISSKKLIIDFILSDYAIGCSGRFNPYKLFDDPRGISGTEINAFGNAYKLAENGHEVRIFSRWTAERKHGNLSFVDYDRKLQQSDVAIAYHDGKPLTTWNTKFKIYSCHTFNVVDGILSVNADLYLSPTELNKSYHEKTGGKWKVLPNACDLGSIRPWNPEKGRMIFHTDPLRGLHILLRALPEIKKRVPEVNLHIYGKNTLHINNPTWFPNVYDEIRNSIYQQRDYITVHEELHSRNDILEAVSKSSVFAYPSEPPIACEVFPISVLECCFTGVPVVLAPADGIEQVYGDAVELVPSPPSKNLNLFIEATIQILTDDNYAKTLSQISKAWASQYNFQKTSTLLENYIKEG